MTFQHFGLKLIEPKFGSDLTNLIIELDYLRKKPLMGSTHPKIFFQLKEVFHFLESLGSARIEGNRTTVAEYIETKIEDRKSTKEDLVEIQNVEQALEFIDENIKDQKIDRSFLSEIHKITVNNLTLPPQGEGSRHPGEFRKENVKIKGAKHTPPEQIKVPEYMEELFNFIETDNEAKYDLIKTALAHHRFAWIHPYDNGNGRVVRLLTYAMLVKQGFKVNMGKRIINPTAIFCNDRNKYNNALSKADDGTEAGLLNWCNYVLSGLKNEIEKIDKLLDYSYLSKEILVPSVDFALDRKVITSVEADILLVAIRKEVFQASDIQHLLKDKIPAARSRFIRQLREKRLIEPENHNSRKHVINFRNSYLLRGIIKMLDEKGFLPIKNETKEL